MRTERIASKMYFPSPELQRQESSVGEPAWGTKPPKEILPGYSNPFSESPQLFICRKNRCFPRKKTLRSHLAKPTYDCKTAKTGSLKNNSRGSKISARLQHNMFCLSTINIIILPDNITGGLGKSKEFLATEKKI